MNRSLGQKIFFFTAILSLCAALAAAAIAHWSSESAFAVFRIADHFANGHGFVYNAAEAPDFSNGFLWPVFVATGIFFGGDALTWALSLGIVFFGASIVLLILNALRFSQRMPSPGLVLPIAPLIAAAHFELAVYGTGGLEIALFSFLALFGFTFLQKSREHFAYAALVAISLGLAAMTKTAGFPILLLGLLYLLLHAQQRWKALLIYGGICISLFSLFGYWAHSITGEVLPFTFYRMGEIEKGAWHALFYIQKYPILLLPIFFIVIAYFRSRPDPFDAYDDEEEMEREKEGFSFYLRESLWPLIFALGLTIHAIFDGGGNLFARAFIPATWFYLIAMERAIVFLFPESHRKRIIATLAITLLTLFAFNPFETPAGKKGIKDAWATYTHGAAMEERRKGETIRRFIKNTEIRFGISDKEARFAYYTDAKYISDCTGASPQSPATPTKYPQLPAENASKAFKECDADIVFDYAIVKRLQARYDLFCPPILFDTVKGYILRWDNELMFKLETNGAVFQDFPAKLDEYLRNMEKMDDSTIYRDYLRFKAFYFDHVEDKQRNAAFLNRLDPPNDSL